MESAYFIVKGRRWRATNPHIPEVFRAALTRELMSARRAVKKSKRDAGEPERVARDRVQDANVALGERGPRWWLPMDDTDARQRITATIRALLRDRGADKSLCPSEVARAQGTPNWRGLMALVRAVAFELQVQGQVLVTQKAKPVDSSAKGPIRLRQGKTLFDPVIA